MAYCTVDDIRALTNLTSSQISDAEITSLIGYATIEINSKLNVKVIREKIGYIDQTRQNDIDGSNTTYYVKNWKGKYFADMDNNGSITIADIIVYAVDSDGVETKPTISSIDHDDSYFVLSTAYDSTYTLYVTYSWSYYDESTPDSLLSLACAYLTSAYSYLKEDTGVSNVRFGNVSINKSLSKRFTSFYSRYEQTLNELRNYSNLKENWKEATVSI